jgi:PPM family protein phosphatase
MVLLASHLENGHRGEDRLLTISTPAGMVVVVADGAGGVGGSAKAAQTVCDIVSRAAPQACGDSKLWTSALNEADRACERIGGLTTAVIVEAFTGAVLGASIGDSVAMLIQQDAVVDLTEHQLRKPLLGSGSATPIAFGPVPGPGRVLVATDGLLKYARPAAIASGCRFPDLERGADALLRAVQLPNGKYHDDVALVLLQVPE